MTTPTKQKKIVEKPTSKIAIERFISVVMRDVNSPKDTPYLLQAVGAQGKLLTLRATPAIWSRVLGTIDDTGNLKNLGLRQLAGVKFILHLKKASGNEKQDTILALDIVPRRMYVSGAIPVSWGNAKTKGFTLTWDEELQGFDTLNDVEGRREAYAGMDETQLYSVMDGIRSATWEKSSSQTIEGHKVTKDGETYNVRPLATTKPTRR